MSGRPFTHCEVGMPKAQGPEENRNGVLNPAMEQRYIARRRRQMGRRGVDEDPDQNVDPNEKASCAEKGFQKLHLSHLLLVGTGAGANE